MYERQQSDPCVESDFHASHILFHSSLFLCLTSRTPLLGCIPTYPAPQKTSFAPFEATISQNLLVCVVAYFTEKINGGK